MAVNPLNFVLLVEPDRAVANFQGATILVGAQAGGRVFGERVEREAVLRALVGLALARRQARAGGGRHQFAVEVVDGEAAVAQLDDLALAWWKLGDLGYADHATA